MALAHNQTNGVKAAIYTTMFMGLAFAAAPAHAQSATPKDLLQCDKIKKPADRLACFNTVVEKLKEDPEAFKRTTHGGQAGRDGKRSSKGRSGSSGSSATSGSSSEFGKVRVQRNTPNEITAKVIRYWQNYYGKWHFHLENGQVWKETSGSSMKLTRKVEQVNIKKGSMGGYRIVIKGATMTGRVKRID